MRQLVGITTLCNITAVPYYAYVLLLCGVHIGGWVGERKQESGGIHRILGSTP